VENGQADSTSLILRQRERKTGAVVAAVFRSIQAGQTLSLKARDVKYTEPGSHQVAGSIAEVEFQSGEIVLDLKGDRESGECLVVDSQGRLNVRSAASYSSEIQRLDGIYQAPEAPGAKAGDFGDLLKR